VASRLPFRLYLIAEGDHARDDCVLLAEKGKGRMAIYWRNSTADDVPGLPAELRPFGTPLFVKESDLAAWPRLRGGGGAAGIHLKSDAALNAGDARSRFAGAAWVARAVHSAREAARARDEGADLAVFGHVYQTASKPGEPGRGVSALAAACRAADPLPVFALGGITLARIPEVISAGAAGVATRSALTGSREARAGLEAWLKALGTG
jgi:thiamine monophosphate synthase